MDTIVVSINYILFQFFILYFILTVNLHHKNIIYMNIRIKH